MKNSDGKKTRASFMTNKQKSQMNDAVRSHENCKAFTGVMRPGKTAKDRAIKDRS